MKRDWNLIRDILTAIEEDRIVEYVVSAGNNEDWQNGLDCDQIKIEKIKRLRLIEGHIRLLIDSNLISKVNSNIRDLNEYKKKPTDTPRHAYVFKVELLQLSMEGHDMLEHMRNDKVWNELKRIAKESSVSLTLDFIRATIPHIWDKVVNSVG